MYVHKIISLTPADVLSLIYRIVYITHLYNLYIIFHATGGKK